MALLKRSEQLMMLCVGGTSFLLSLLSLVLEPFDLAQGVREHIPQVSLLLLSSFVLYFASRERLTSEFAKWKGLGITDIYTSRTEVGQYDAYYQILHSARNELFIVGITQKNIAREHAQLLVRKASRGCSIDLLVSEPTLLMSLEETGVHDGLRLDFCRAVAGLRTLAIQVARAGAAGNLEVRFSRKIPTICPALSRPVGKLPSLHQGQTLDGRGERTTGRRNLRDLRDAGRLASPRPQGCLRAPRRRFSWRGHMMPLLFGKRGFEASVDEADRRLAFGRHSH